jgi:hypothetical protein
MANTTFSGPVRSLAGFQNGTKNSATGAVTTRYTSVRPDKTGLAVNDLATDAAITLDDNSLNVVNYTGAAAAVATLPAATNGSVCVYVQALDTAGGTNTLIFKTAGTDVFATGSVIESTGSSEITFDVSTAGENQITFTPADAVTNILTTGSKIYFVCFADGTWNIDFEMTQAAAAVTGTMAFGTQA